LGGKGGKVLGEKELKKYGRDIVMVELFSEVN
jgi:hypothetical protein